MHGACLSLAGGRATPDGNVMTFPAGVRDHGGNLGQDHSRLARVLVPSMVLLITLTVANALAPDSFPGTEAAEWRKGAVLGETHEKPIRIL